MNIVENVATELVPNPDKEIERKKFIKKGFSFVKNAKRLKIPQTYTCIYERKLEKNGGMCGCDHSIKTWKVFNNKNKLVVKIIQSNDGDYYGGDLITWM